MDTIHVLYRCQFSSILFYMFKVRLIKFVVCFMKEFDKFISRSKDQRVGNLFLKTNKLTSICF